MERILAHKKRDRDIQYLIQWKNYQSVEDIQKALYNLKNAKTVMEEYYKKKALPIQKKKKTKKKFKNT